MKKIYIIIFFAFTSLNIKVNAQIVNIPDYYFREALYYNGVPDSAGYITVNIAKVFTGKLNVSWGYSVYNIDKITDLTGIQAFTAITALDCSQNSLTSLDVSSNTALDTLDCSGNNITSLDVSSNTTLVSLNCAGNPLDSLDVHLNTALTYLNCSYIFYLASLNLSTNTNLTYLECSYDGLATLDVSVYTALSYLNCSYNNISSLNVSSNTALTYLNCLEDGLTTLNVSSNTALTYLECGFNNIKNLDVSSNTALTMLECSGDSLTSLNVSSNTALDTLDCSNNSITSLDVSSNHSITFLYCYNDRLTSLNVKNGNNYNMTQFFADGNPDLYCIEVDDPAYAFRWNQGVVWAIDEWASFSTDCSGNGDVYIPDTNFKAALLADTAINTNRDTAIQFSEALAYTGEIDVPGLSISDLTGIKSFRALTGLNCDSNSLNILDLSVNTSLSKITCSANNLTRLNVQNGNNYNIPDSNFDATHNDLACIEVDNVAYSTANWTHIDARTTFGTGCFYLVGVNEITAFEDVNIYPNPVTTQLTIETNGQKAVSVKLYNMLGEMLNSQNPTGKSITIDINGVPTGIYLIQITDADKNIINKKIIKQ